jgi:hypothetical protein
MGRLQQATSPAKAAQQAHPLCMQGMWRGGRGHYTWEVQEQQHHHQLRKLGGWAGVHPLAWKGSLCQLKDPPTALAFSPPGHCKVCPWCEHVGVGPCWDRGRLLRPLQSTFHVWCCDIAACRSTCLLGHGVCGASRSHPLAWAGQSKGWWSPEQSSRVHFVSVCHVCPCGCGQQLPRSQLEKGAGSAGDPAHVLLLMWWWWCGALLVAGG